MSMDDFPMDLYVLSQNKRMALQNQRRSYWIKIVDVETKKTLHYRSDYSGYINIGFFTQNDKFVVYMTFDEHNWRLAPNINLWNLKKDSVETIHTKHDPQHQYIEFAYHKKLERLVLGGLDGSVSAYSTQPLKSIWYYERPVYDRTSYHLNEEILSIDISDCGDKIAVLDKKTLTLYDFNTGKQLLVYPLKKQYSKCKFQDQLSAIYLSDLESEPLKLSLYI